ncbi:MAG: ATP-binding cassette domain-containing protein [Cardiobacteriaceae bacterium]|nr:ATP-binding cassette domain-containing protein [Cardiobacteriaceae bacterium]
MTTPLITLNNIGFRHHQREILREIDFEVLPNQIVTIVGPNGAGKSTLLKILLGLLKPTHGHLTRKPQLSISYVPQKFPILPDLPMTVKRFVQGLGVEKHQNLLERLNLLHLQESALQKLSGGELQRLLLLRAMLRQPELIVLDEPAAGVDPAALNDFYRIIYDFQREQATSILMVSHDLHLMMAASDHVLCLNQAIRCQGTPEAITQHPEFIRLLGQTSFESMNPEYIGVFTHQHRGAE